MGLVWPQRTQGMPGLRFNSRAGSIRYGRVEGSDDGLNGIIAIGIVIEQIDGELSEIEPVQ
jgi:hypothetical protein